MAIKCTLPWWRPKHSVETSADFLILKLVSESSLFCLLTGSTLASTSTVRWHCEVKTRQVYSSTNTLANTSTVRWHCEVKTRQLALSTWPLLCSKELTRSSRETQAFILAQRCREFSSNITTHESIRINLLENETVRISLPYIQYGNTHVNLHNLSAKQSLR